MEGRGGGGGGTGGGFRYGNLQNNPPSSQRPSPPLTAIDRFLWSQKNVENNRTLVSSNGFCDFSSCGGSIGAYDGGGVSWPIDSSFFDGEKYISAVVYKEEAKPSTKISKGMAKRVKNGGLSTAALIKGQWTDEEDRKLIRLVKQHGVRKWAQIAEKMIGRAGKQCRERWHNHLRPDIKKDTWSEEEERMLVEAHQKVGNKWAEIAKRIPGRTENSIKNHWNATKRRQNSRRKSKKDNQGKSVQSSLLQDYIRSKTSTNGLTSITSTITPTNSCTTTNNTTPENSSISDDPSIKFNMFDDSPSLIPHTDDEELNFMINFFGSSNSNESLVYDSTRVVDPREAEASQKGLVKNTSTPEPNMHGLNNYSDENTPQTHLYSDLYLSYLLDGATPVPSNDCGYNDMNMDLKMNCQGGSSSGKKEMDLIEMVSSSQFSQGSSN
ncbi:hypothetical protein RJ640_015272 [Escallonia rubra]|uniref:Uncharacterized protein n=1 Tax=Escallonia rubra TaxID=112253 RepID=A0AA88U9M4_9ASTE|nr:hypothetical protein RJ640_015272 [Escallonia rubra]